MIRSTRRPQTCSGLLVDVMVPGMLSDSERTLHRPESLCRTPTGTHPLAQISLRGSQSWLMGAASGCPDPSPASSSIDGACLSLAAAEAPVVLVPDMPAEWAALHAVRRLGANFGMMRARAKGATFREACPDS